jgi:DNA-binding MarR family transcriptional regulator
MAGKNYISDLDSHLGYWLRVVSNAVSLEFARKLEREGVTVAEWVFLRVLYGASPVAPSKLAERMGMTKGAISKLADRLTAKALVERGADPDDRRGQTLSLTAAARPLVERLSKLADANDIQFFGALSPEERAEMERLLRKIVAKRSLRNVATE